MSKELNVALGTSGLTVTANVYLLGVAKATGIACAEIGTTGTYQGDFSATPNVAGVYHAVFFNGAATVACGEGQIVWDGTAEVQQTGDSFARIGAAGAGLTAVVAASVTGSVGSVASYGTLVADTATAVWAAGTRSLTTFGTLVSDTAAAVWSAISRTITGTVQLDANQPNYAPAVAGDAMTLTAAYDAAKTAASQTSVNAIPTTPLLAADYTAPDNATIANNNAGISAIYNIAADGTSGNAALKTLIDTVLAEIGTPDDWGSGATLFGNLYDANAWINVIMAAVIDGTSGNAALKALIDALPAATRDVSNSSPAAGSLGEAVRGADAKAADIQITLGTPVDTVSADIAAIGTATTAVGIRTAVGLSNPDLDTQLAAKPSLVDILRTAMTEGYAMAGSAPTLEQFLFMIEAQLRSRVLTGTAPAVLTSHKLDGTTDAMTFSVDDTTSPTTQERVS